MSPTPPITHRATLARTRAGLSIGQAAKLLGLDRHTLEQIEARPLLDREDHARAMADIYAVNLPWLHGTTPLRDYAYVDAIRGAEHLTTGDRDELAEFAASLSGKRDVT